MARSDWAVFIALRIEAEVQPGNPGNCSPFGFAPRWQREKDLTAINRPQLCLIRASPQFLYRLFLLSSYFRMASILDRSFARSWFRCLRSKYSPKADSLS